MERERFVARERQLGQLDAFLSRALAGQGQVCFVVGEAGCGKTTLVTEFARRSLEQHQGLVVAVGQSDAQTGAGDPYLPFREVLGQLTGDVEAKLAEGAITQENAGRLRRLLRLSGQALTEVGPDLIGAFVPGAGLAMRVGAFVAERVGWLDKLERLAGRPRESGLPSGAGIEQSQIFEQYTNVLRALAEKQPLLLLLDDLQWADAASVDLLFRLGRRVGDSRILIVGTYRPDEVALGRAGERHPLDKVLGEFKRYFGDVQVDLDQAKKAEGRQFVEAFLDTEPNRLGEGFRQALYQHTGGHPLFTIELLRDMQERGDLIQNGEGCWIEGPVLNWAALPARVEGVIEERIGRLEEALREVLTVASVEGEDFTAEVVARVQEMDTRGLIRRLSRELDKGHRLVSAQGIQRVGAQRLSLYRFQHNLFQKYLYGELDEVERSFLHEDVGNVLEELYGDQVDEIVVQLAFHFSEAGVAEKAATYLHRAGEQAATRFANTEAVAYLSQALELTPETGQARRYDLLLAREKVYDLQGAREAQRQDLVALEELADVMEDGLSPAEANRRRAEVALRRSNCAEVTSDYPQAIASAIAAITAAQLAQDVNSEAAGHLQWGQALWHQGENEAARNQLERALALARDAGLRLLQADSLRSLGLVCWNQGDYTGARVYYDQSLSIYREVGDRRQEGKVLSNLGILYWERGDYDQTRVLLEQVLPIYREIGFRQGEGWALGNLGALLLDQGGYGKARDFLKQSRLIFREIGDRQSEGAALQNLGTSLFILGDYAGARDYAQQALRIYREIGDRQGEGFILINLGQISYHLDDDSEATREKSQQALRIAQDLGDRPFQAVALTSLGHALVKLGQLAGAEDAYQQALAMRQDLGQPHLAMESLAGLARVSLVRGELARAQEQVREILGYLETGTLDGTEEIFTIYLTCYRVLKANRDPRAQDILNTARRLLQERAANIGQEELRRMFLEGIGTHREVIREWEAQ